MPKEQKLNENKPLNQQQQQQQSHYQQQQQTNQMPSSSVSSAYPFGISFSSSMSHTNESDDMAYIEKRTAHNALERQRREGLNTKFQELAHVLPALQQIRRPSKSMIVAKSLEFVSMAQEREADYQDQLRTLRRENEQLMRQADIHKKKMKKRSDQPRSKTSSPVQQQIVDRNKEREVSPSNTILTSSTEESGYMKASASCHKKKKKSAGKMKPQSRPPPPVPSSSSSPSQQHAGKKRSRSELSQDESVLPIQQPLVSPPLVQSTPNAKKIKAHSIAIENTILPSQQVYPLLESEQQAIFQHQFIRQRYNSLHSLSSSGSHVLPVSFQPSMLSPAVSRSNSLTVSDPLPTAFQTDGTELLVNLSSLDVTSSPFGAEHIFHDTFNHVVSSIPATRTPIGSHLPLSSASSPSTSMIQPPSQDIHYDPTLSILSLMQSQDPTGHQYWH